MWSYLDNEGVLCLMLKLNYTLIYVDQRSSKSFG